jgi:hypothetical protein
MARTRGLYPEQWRKAITSQFEDARLLLGSLLRSCAVAYGGLRPDRIERRRPAPGAASGSQGHARVRADQGCPGLRLNEHNEADGSTVYAHACKMGLEGIVSKRKDSRYISGRSQDWLKSKNPESAAVRREAEEDWGNKGWR